MMTNTTEIGGKDRCRTHKRDGGLTHSLTSVSSLAPLSCSANIHSSHKSVVDTTGMLVSRLKLTEQHQDTRVPPSDHCFPVPVSAKLFFVPKIKQVSCAWYKMPNTEQHVHYKFPHCASCV